MACDRNEPYHGGRCDKARRMRGGWDKSIQTDFFELVGGSVVLRAHTQAAADTWLQLKRGHGCNMGRG
eukprot:COSAG01_NODE_2357_length_7839_cov_6.117571_1_plen_68_part_00